MEYILSPESGIINFTGYIEYVESIRCRLPSHVYEFASNPAHFDLTSHSSLHDAWLDSLVVREVGRTSKGDTREVEVEIILLGPFHDRRIRLTYTGVAGYNFSSPPRFQESGSKFETHGDLFTHEVRLAHDGLLIHELLFERGATLIITCRDLRHLEVPVEPVP